MFTAPLKKTTALCACLMITACETTNRVDDESQLTPLINNEGYLSLVIDSLDPLKNLEFEAIDENTRFYEGRMPVGINQLTLKVPEGEYCFVGFDVYDLRVDYTTKGFCVYVEAGEVNYMGELMIRNPVTSIVNNYPRFLKIFSQQFPTVCQELIDPRC